MVQNHTEEFSRVIRSSSRYLDNMIDDYVFESDQRLQDIEGERKRTLREAQFRVIDSVFEEEAQSIAKIPTQTAAESQFWLGKEQGMKRAITLLKEWKEKLMI